MKSKRNNFLYYCSVAVGFLIPIFLVTHVSAEDLVKPVENLEDENLIAGGGHGKGGGGHGGGHRGKGGGHHGRSHGNHEGGGHNYHGNHHNENGHHNRHNWHDHHYYHDGYHELCANENSL